MEFDFVSRRIALLAVPGVRQLLAFGTAPDWSAMVLTPLWESRAMEAEPVLFIRNTETELARGRLLFSPESVTSVRNSAGDITYLDGRDYVWSKGARELVLPRGSRIPCSLPSDLRRPPNSQKYRLTHRDGGGDILFAEKLEYAALQSCVTYTHGPAPDVIARPTAAGTKLERTLEKLREHKPVRIALIGDSISAGCNASGWAGAAPFQPAYPELFRAALERRFGGQVRLDNLSVGGKDTVWGLSMAGEVAARHPDLVVVAFGMNDAAGRAPAEYRANTQALIEAVRKQVPLVEFILVATMPGNPDWTRLHPDYFPKFRDGLASLCGPGVALADVTSVWDAMLRRKEYLDLTGNGVNHPNDFGHRVYAQVLTHVLTA